MNRILIVLMAFMVTAVGCLPYDATEAPDREPNYQSYCQRIDDMAIGIEPYMKKDKTHYVFNEDLWDEQVLALDVSMLADGGKTYTVKKAEISATDEFENEYVVMDGMEAERRIGTMKTHELITQRELPDEIKVTGELTQGMLYFDMEPNNAEARRFTVYFFATADDGSGSKEFAITVDPYRMFMNPTERWTSYYGGVVPCGWMTEAEEPMMEAPAAMAPEPAEEPEMTPEERDEEFEKGLYK